MDNSIKKVINCLLGSLLTVSASAAFASQVSDGTWYQTSSTAGDCPNCLISIERDTPHIIKLTANNGWTGYGYYSSNSDSYTGAFQWKSGEYKNHVFFMDLTYEGKTLTMKARGNGPLFSATFRKK